MTANRETLPLANCLLSSNTSGQQVVEYKRQTTESRNLSDRHCYQVGIVFSTGEIFQINFDTCSFPAIQPLTEYLLLNLIISAVHQKIDKVIS